MRALVFLLAVALPLAACGKSGEAEGEREGSAMTANAISSNDLTAIDAVTGEAANIAADVQIDANLIADANADSNQASPSERRRRPGRPSSGSASSPSPVEDRAAPAEPQANSAQ